MKRSQLDSSNERSLRRRDARAKLFAAPLCVVLCVVLAAADVASAAGDAEALDASQQNAQHYEDLSLFSNVLELVRGSYVEPVDQHELLMDAMRGILAGLDPHSSFMSPDAFEDMQVETKGEFQGLGVEISKEAGTYIEVVSPIDGTPAMRAGIKARDRITAICPTEKPADWAEGEECRGTMKMTIMDAVALMRGRRGTSITIYVIRQGMPEPKRYEIKRDTVKVASVRSRMLEPGVGYIKISSFQERTGRDVRKKLDRLRKKNEDKDLSGLVLDLRDNPGGLLNQAVEVADHWLREGLVVYTQGRDESQRTDYGASPQTLEADYPIAVLVNEGSASASEIVAGALQDHHRAIVVGVRTFGKGSVQTVYPLEGGAGLRLTTALYYTPAGRSIQEVGITPDLEVRQDDAATLGLPERRRMRESDLQGHFTQERAAGEPSGAPAGQSPERILDDELEDGEKTPGGLAGVLEPPEPPKDVQLARAVEVLKSWSYFEDLRRLREEMPPVVGDPIAVSKAGSDGAYAPR